MKQKQLYSALMLGAFISGGSAIVHAAEQDARNRFQMGDFFKKPDLRSNRTDWIYEGVSTLKLDRDIKHYKWITKVGDGPYDMIRVHRYVSEKGNAAAMPNRPAPNRSKVLFIINGTWGQEGPEPIEQFETYYFAKQGYDVWTMDFRTGFISNLALDQFEEKGELEGLKSTSKWTYGVFREDIKKAVEFAKKNARTRKLFMAGRSRGGSQLFIYAAKYENDLKGMIGLDGGPIYQGEEDPSKQQPKEAYDTAVAAMCSDTPPEPLLGEVGFYENGKLLGALPNATAQVGEPIPDAAELPNGAPPDGSEINDLADYAAYVSYYMWGEGGVTNIYTPYPGGNGETYMDKAALKHARPNYSRYWPSVQNVESGFLAGYADNPYLDYDDTQDVTVPVIHFVGDFGCRGGTCLDQDRPYSTSSEDFTVKYLPGFGHLDVYYGTHSEEEVKKPMLDWMNERL